MTITGEGEHLVEMSPTQNLDNLKKKRNGAKRGSTRGRRAQSKKTILDCSGIFNVVIVKLYYQMKKRRF